MNETSTLVVGMLTGAAILAATLGVLWLGKEFWRGCSALTESFNRISDGIGSLKMTNSAMLEGFADVSIQLKKLVGELEFLRTVMTGGTPPGAEPGAPAASAAPTGPSGKPIPQFPSWQPFVAAPADAPDAAESDTEIIDTADEELAEQEMIDEIRGQGFAAGPEADPTENPPGVTASV